MLILILAAQLLYSRIEHWRLRAVFEERERLAFEIHDTIAQSFIREVFERVSKIVQPILPHDIMGVVEINEAADRIKLLAGAGSLTGTPPFEGTIADPEMLKRSPALVEQIRYR